MTALESSNKQQYLLLTFIFGNPTQVKRYTNWGTSIDPQGANFVSVPKMEVRLPANTGILGAKDLQISMDIDDSTRDFLEPLTRSVDVYGPVECQIMEVVEGVDLGDSATQTMPFRGRVSKTILNDQEIVDRVRIDVRNVKARQNEASLGLQCSAQCQARLYGPGCATGNGFGGPSGTGVAASGPQQFNERKLVRVDTIDGVVMTMQTDPSLAAPKTFQFGYAALNGLHIDIFDWDALDPMRIVLRRQAPVEWLGQQIELFPGCDNTIAGCRTLWGNEDNFMGYGVGMPAHDPSLESPQ